MQYQADHILALLRSLEVPDTTENRLKIADQEERIDIVVHKLKFIAEDQKPIVAILENMAPAKFAESGYYNELIRIAGGRILGLPSQEEVSDETDILILLAKEKSVPQLISEVPMVLDLPEWKAVNAVKNNKVFLVDGTQKLCHNYAHMADDVELLAEMLYPQYFVFSEPGETWMQFEL